MAAYHIRHLIIRPGPTDDAHKACEKGHSGQPEFRGWRHPFLPAPKIDKIVGNFRKQNEKERTRVVCSRDVKQMNIRSLQLADESG